MVALRASASIGVELLAALAAPAHPDAATAGRGRVQLAQLPALRRGRAARHGERPRAAPLPARGASWSLGAGLLSWAAQFLGIWLTLRAFGIDSHTLGAAAAVFVASNVVGLVPDHARQRRRLPARRRAGAARQLRRRPDAPRITFGIGLQVIEVALGAGLGFVFLSLEGLSFGEVRRGMSAAAIEDADGAVAVPRLAPTRAERRRQLVWSYSR